MSRDIDWLDLQCLDYTCDIIGQCVEGSCDELGTFALEVALCGVRREEFRLGG